MTTVAPSAAPPADATSSIAAAAQTMKLQQAQLMNQMNQMISSADLSCAKGTDCYTQLQITNAQNEYNAAVLNEKNAPKKADVALQNYLVLSKGQNGANEALKSRYTQNGEEEKAKLTQQFEDWYKTTSNKIDIISQQAETGATLQTSNKLTTNSLNAIATQNDDATNELNLLERKTHYTAQQVKTINGIEYYVKLVYWLAFLTWIGCVIYDRTMTMKTGGLFVVFTLFILLQNRIMNAIGFLIPTDVHMKW
jgi:hypothetical protein